MTRPLLKVTCGLGLSLVVLLTAGCGSDKPVEDQDQPGQQYSGPSHQSGITPATLAPAPATATGGDPLAATDQLASGANGVAKSAGDVPTNGSGDALAGDLPIPTAYRHWLTVSQFGAQVKLRVNGVAQGGFAASATSEITMVMHPGSNTITMEYDPQSSDAWARVYVTRDPPLPQLTLFDSTSLPAQAAPEPKIKAGTKPKFLTKTFTLIVR